MLPKENGVHFIVVYLPSVSRVNFFDVDRVEVDLIPKFVVDAIEGPSLGPERRSGIAAEYEGDGALSEMI